jgi:hypothetical protein
VGPASVASAAPADGAPARADQLIQVATARWLWLVAAAGAVFVVVGTALYWALLTRRNPFVSGVGTADAIADQVLMSLSPQLVVAGVIGIVGAVLGWALVAGTGSRRRR